MIMVVNDVWLVTAVFLTLLLAILLWLRQRHLTMVAAVAEVVLRDVYATQLDNHRDIFVYLPPGYGDGDQHYPVLYVNDGQDREALRLRETVARLTLGEQIRPLIVVAVPTTNERLEEYGTAVAPERHDIGQKAAAYTHFMTQELMPAINQQFRTRMAAADTVVLGASLGGLSAFDLAWNQPALFGVVGVMSGSFWWRAGEMETAVAPNRRIAHEMVRNDRYRPGWRGWFEAATRDERDDRDNNGVIDAIQDTLELLDELEALGYERGKEIVYLEVAGGRHNYETWSKVLPDFLKWAFGK